MTDQRQRSSGQPRARITAAVLAALAVAGSLVFMIADGHPRARARVTSSAPAGDAGGLAAQIQANIAAQREHASERSTQIDRHALRDPDDQPLASEIPAIAGAQRVVRHWLAGYLPYEVDHVGPSERGDLSTTSTASLARSLLTHTPLIPPAQQHHRPPEGRLLGLITKLATDRSQAQIYVEVAYGLERESFHLTLIRGEHGWLVASFRG